MLKRPTLTLFAIAALAVAFGYGIVQLLALGYRSGDVYPPYSSLRADPLGCKVLHDALSELPGIRVRRNFRALPRLETQEPLTIVYAGIARRVFWSQSELNAFESRVTGGARAVFAFLPAERTPTSYEMRSAEKDDRKRRREREDEEAEESSLLSFDEVAKRWSVAFDYLPASEDKAYARKAITTADTATEREISWHSALYFKDPGPEWKTLYTCDGQPVVIERAFGAGSIVLAADAYALSNEAMRRERHPALLGRLFSGPPAVLFDEEHLGVREQPGIANLARKYRLHGAAATLLVLAALFVWKSATPFLPPREDPAADGVVTGKESAEGFVNLLRRTIRPAELTGVCVDEWRKTSTHAPHDRARLEEAWAAEQARPAKERNPVATYRTLCQMLRRKS